MNTKHTELVDGLWSRTSSLKHFAFEPFKIGDTLIDAPDDEQVKRYRLKLIDTIDALRASTLAPAHPHFKRANREAVYKAHLATMANLQHLLKHEDSDPEMVAHSAFALLGALTTDESVAEYFAADAKSKSAPSIQEEAINAFGKIAYMLVGAKKAYILIDNKERNALFGGVPPDAPLYNILDTTSAKMIMANRPLIEIDSRGNEKRVSIIDRWQESTTARREIFGVAMHPGVDQRVVQGQFNVWQGWSVEPEEGTDDAPFWELLHALCNQNDAYYSFIRKFLAHMVQRPTERPMCAIGIAGEQGCGKSSLAKVIGSLMHRSHYNGAMTMEDITGRFTGSLATTLFGFLDEASWGGDIAGAGRLKAFITATEDRIEFKGIDAFTVSTYKRIIFASNNPYYYHADKDDRRLLPLEPDGKIINKHSAEFWKRFHGAHENGKMLANLMHTLRAEDVAGWEPHSALQKLPINTGSELAENSMTTIERWVKFSLNNKSFQIPLRDGPTLLDIVEHTDPRISTARFMESYDFYCAQSNLDKIKKRSMNDTASAKLLREVFGKVTNIGKNTNGRKFDWNAARAAFTNGRRFNIEWDEEPTTADAVLQKFQNVKNVIALQA